MTIDRLALEEACSHGYRTLADLGEQFGVTRERIRQLTKKYGIDRGNHAIEHWDELTYGSRVRHSPRSHWPRGLTRREFKKKQGYCLRSGCNRVVASGKKHCEACLKDMTERANRNEYGKQRKARAVATGLCTMCLKLPPREGRKHCAACAAKARAATKKWAMKKDNRVRMNAWKLARRHEQKAILRKEAQESRTFFGRLIRRIRKEWDD